MKVVTGKGQKVGKLPVDKPVCCLGSTQYFSIARFSGPLDFSCKLGTAEKLLFNGIMISSYVWDCCASEIQGYSCTFFWLSFFPVLASKFGMEWDT